MGGTANRKTVAGLSKRVARVLWVKNTVCYNYMGSQRRAVVVEIPARPGFHLTDVLY